jgi:type II restriction enzyme
MLIKAAFDLVTSRQETRTGFIEFALEKNRRSKPFIESARHLRTVASKAKVPGDLLKIKEIQGHLLTASGLSDKAVNYFTEDDKFVAIDALIKNFLEPAGEEFVDEVVYRYLLIKGDTLGGSMRNIIGALAQQKLLRSLLAVMTGNEINYSWLSTEKNALWVPKPKDDYGIENSIKAIAWANKKGSRTFVFNLTIPAVGKNIDLCLFDIAHTKYSKDNIAANDCVAIMLGELKGGIDPAGADEHWKTANTALTRIREAFAMSNPNLKTAFIGAAIESSMAEEIFNQLKQGKLSFAANLTNNEQIYAFCNWLLSL